MRALQNAREENLDLVRLGALGPWGLGPHARMLKSFGRLVHEPSITRAAALTARLISAVAALGRGVSDGSLALLRSTRPAHECKLHGGPKSRRRRSGPWSPSRGP